MARRGCAHAVIAETDRSSGSDAPSTTSWRPQDHDAVIPTARPIGRNAKAATDATTPKTASRMVRSRTRRARPAVSRSRKRRRAMSQSAASQDRSEPDRVEWCGYRHERGYIEAPAGAGYRPRRTVNAGAISTVDFANAQVRLGVWPGFRRSGRRWPWRGGLPSGGQNQGVRSGSSPMVIFQSSSWTL